MDLVKIIFLFFSSIINNRKIKNESTFCAFIDMGKAFDGLIEISCFINF